MNTTIVRALALGSAMNIVVLVKQVPDSGA